MALPCRAARGASPLIVLVIVGCSSGTTRVPTAPMAAGEHSGIPELGDQALAVSHGYYPLVVGDTRAYLYTYSEQRTWDDGRMDPVRTVTSTITRRVEADTVVNGVRYYREIHYRPAGSEHVVARYYLWEDKTGLHRRWQLPGDKADKPSIAVPVDAEQLLLEYPLHPGAKWALNASQPQVLTEVEGRDVLEVPTGRIVAWRVVEANPEPASANGPRRYWYSRDGYVRMAGTSEFTSPPFGSIQGYTERAWFNEVLTSRVVEATQRSAL